ncbi:hypothetical protein [Streptomyces antibioticus]|uniref:hypothetical protein n=1 Tax=Streptomyces antibioticus TaxID=1890 RepID=UPI003D703A23
MFEVISVRPDFQLGLDQAKNSWVASNIFSPQVIASVVAACAAIIAAVIAARTARRQRQSAKNERKTDFYRRQLNDLYGQLYMLRQASKSLYATLHVAGERPEGWRLVDHIGEIVAEGDKSKIGTVEQIIKINKSIEDLLVAHFGLADTFPPPKSFQDFVSHSRQLQVAWKKKGNLEIPRISFPVEIDEDIENSIKAILARISELDAA